MVNFNMEMYQLSTSDDPNHIDYDYVPAVFSFKHIPEKCTRSLTDRNERLQKRRRTSRANIPSTSAVNENDQNPEEIFQNLDKCVNEKGQILVLFIFINLIKKRNLSATRTSSDRVQNYLFLCIVFFLKKKKRKKIGLKFVLFSYGRSFGNK